MIRVVADTTVLFPGLVDPHSLYRKVLIVFAWGNLHAQLRAAEAEREEIARLLEEFPGAEDAGSPDTDLVIQQTRERIAALEERLPALTPTEFVLVTSQPILDELHHCATSPRSNIGGLTDDQADIAVQQALQIAADAIIEPFPADIPHYTEGRDRKDDPIIHTAVVTGAPLILSQDKAHICTNKHKHPTEYQDPNSESTHEAVTINYFLENHMLAGLHFDKDKLQEIEGEWLDLVVRDITP